MTIIRHFSDDPKLLHDYAEEARIQGEQMTSDDRRRAMFQCAEDYAWMAVQAAVHLAALSPHRSQGE